MLSEPYTGPLKSQSAVVPPRELSPPIARPRRAASPPPRVSQCTVSPRGSAGPQRALSPHIARASYPNDRAQVITAGSPVVSLSPGALGSSRVGIDASQLALKLEAAGSKMAGKSRPKSVGFAVGSQAVDFRSPPGTLTFAVDNAQDLCSQIFAGTTNFKAQPDTQTVGADKAQDLCSQIFGGTINYKVQPDTQTSEVDNTQDLCSQIFGGTIKYKATPETQTAGVDNAQNLCSLVFGGGSGTTNFKAQPEPQTFGVDNSQDLCSLVFGGGTMKITSGIIDDCPQQGRSRAESESKRFSLGDLGEASFDFGESQEDGQEDDPMASRVTRLLRDRDLLKTHVVYCFKQASTNEQLDMSGLRSFQKSLSTRIEVPDAAFEGIEVDFERFDFNASASLSVNQTYKMVKFNLLEFRKQLGGMQAEANIPIRPLEGAGYTILKALGEGNQGAAKLAETRRGEQVCIKCYPKDRMTASGVEDITQEFEALKLLACDVIASASEMFQDASFYYMVGDFYPGGEFTTLKERALSQDVVLSEEWLKDLFKQAFVGIAFMHEQAMIHCDIKEPNLMLRTTDFRRPQVVIIDLGVALCMAKNDTGTPQGTPGYVPPETLETLKWFPRGDLFSMGVVIMQMMIDKVPIVGGARDRNTLGGIFHEGCINAKEIFAATRTRRPPFELMPEQFPQLTALVEKLLQKRRQDRPTARNALRDPWFPSEVEEFPSDEEGEAPSFGHTASLKCTKTLNPKSAFATVGITSSFLMSMDDVDDSDDDDDAYEFIAKKKKDIA